MPLLLENLAHHSCRECCARFAHFRLALLIVVSVPCAALSKSVGCGIVRIVMFCVVRLCTAMVGSRRCTNAPSQLSRDQDPSLDPHLAIRDSCFARMFFHSARATQTPITKLGRMDRKPEGS